jgi:hypothetical protein
MLHLWPGEANVQKQMHVKELSGVGNRSGRAAPGKLGDAISLVSVRKQNDKTGVSCSQISRSPHYLDATLF